MGEAPWRQEERLRTGYRELGSIEAMANEWDCSTATIHTWMEKYTIPRRKWGTRPDDTRFTDASWLREMYHGKELSSSQIAELCETTKVTILNWMDRHGIEKRSGSEAAKLRMEQYPTAAQKLINAGSEALSRNRSIHPNYFLRGDSRYAKVQDGTTKEQVSMHRLLATLLVDELNELDGMHVHHEDSDPWNNQPENLTALTPDEHAEIEPHVSNFNL